MGKFSSKKIVSLLPLFLLIIFSTVIYFGSASPTILYNKLCQDIEEPKDWLLLKEYKKREVPEQHIKEFPEWKDSYKSIKKFLKYCNDLRKNAEPVQQQNAFEYKEFKHLALKPNFLDANKKELKISEAMSKIVEAYKIMLSKLVKMKIKLTKKLEPKAKNMLEKLHLYSKKELPVMEFTNRSDCLKVSQWVSLYAKNNTDEEAKTELIKVQLHIFYGEKLELSDPPPKKLPQKTTTLSEKTNEKWKKIEEGLKKVGKKVILKKEKKSKKRTKNHKEKEEEEEEEEEEESSSSSSSSEVSDQQSNEGNFLSSALLGSYFTGNGTGGEDGPTTNSNDNEGWFSGLFKGNSSSSGRWGGSSSSRKWDWLGDLFSGDLFD